jgi:hypothetical protein
MACRRQATTSFRSSLQRGWAGDARLTVDDDEPLRKLLQHWVQAEGATVFEAGTLGCTLGFPRPVVLMTTGVLEIMTIECLCNSTRSCSVR